MSEVYPARDPLIVLCDPPENCFNYVKEQRQGGSEVVFWLGIRKKVLRRWCQLKKETPGLKYVDMVNGNIPGNAFKIDPESKRVEKRLTYHCSQASSAKANLNRSGSLSKRFEDEEKVIKVSILKSDVISVEKWEASLSMMERRLKEAKEEIGQWREKYQNLEKEKEELYNEMLAEVTTKYVNEHNIVEKMEKENEQLLKEIENLEKQSLGEPPRGARIPELKTRQSQNRKLKQLKTRAQKALHFVQLFCLELECLKMKDPGSSNTFTVDFNSHNMSAQATSDQNITQYEKLSNDDKVTVESILYLMDKFGVGDEFVHELSMSVADFPIKSYLIKQRRAELNRQVKITTTPGLAPGAQYSFKSLLKERIKDMVGTSPRKKNGQLPQKYSKCYHNAMQKRPLQFYTWCHRLS